MNSKSISIGKTTDSFENLQILSQREAEKISKTLEIEQGKKQSFAFLTSDFPELICEATFSKDDEGNIVFNLDFEQTTL